MKNHKKHKLTFTLIELITAMAIFSVLMVIMMRFFNEAQKAWTESSKRSMLYSNARIAMDLITRDLQCAIYTQNQTPFWHCRLSSPDNNTKEMLSFITETPMRPNDECLPTCEVQYKLFYTTTPTDASAGWLMRRVTGDVNDDGSTNTRWKVSGNFNVAASGGIAKVFTRDNSSSGDANETYDGNGFIKVIPYVTQLKFNCFKSDNSPIPADSDHNAYTLNSAGHDNAFPYLVKVSLSMLDKDSWKKWIAMGGDPSLADPSDDSNDTDPQKEFRKRYERTFTKLIFMGDKGQ